MAMISLDHVRAALALPNFDVEAARMRMTPQSRTYPRPTAPADNSCPAAVLALLFPLSGELALVLMRRTDRVDDAHRGQVSFPGGRREGDEPLVQTALRETEEELGVEAGVVRIMGRLANLHTPSAFTIHPFVGYVPAHPLWRPCEMEVARVIELPLAQLIDDRAKQVEEWELAGHAFTVPFYRVDGEAVWGATAMMLSELEWRLRTVLGR